MLKYVTVFLPMIIVLFTAFNIGASYIDNNISALFANITALAGWLVISFNSFIDYANRK
jgi:hypothetical protein